MSEKIDTGKYTLIERVPVPCENVLVWAEWLENSDQERQVGLSEVGPYRISTVFLGIDHNWRLRAAGSNHEPLLFESRVFIPNDDGVYWLRCSTWEQAELMHARAVLWARGVVDAVSLALES